ncbi:hypothetical protein [Pseudodesulfovibrio profundus]|nr:hypothetical protein [Pseudodesulfovibrio profundus]
MERFSMLFRITTLLSAVILSVVLCASSARAETYSFDSDREGWTFYGNGEGEYRPGIGADAPGSLYLSCNAGESSTVYRKLDVPPGKYLVTARIRTLDVQENRYGPLWIFYQASPKIEYASKDVSGTNAWSTIRFTIDNQKKGITFWFRLRAAGMIWIDDFTIEAYQGETAAFEMKSANLPASKVNPPGQGVRCPDCMRWHDAEARYCPVCGYENTATRSDAVASVGDERILLGFESADASTEGGTLRMTGYSTKDSTQGDQSAVVPVNRFINVDVKKLQATNWDGYDYIALDIHNPTSGNHKLSLALGDIHGSGYWNELNHYSMLAPGWNRLKFHINRYVGERGSVKVKRYLDLKHIQKAWFYIEQKDKGESGDFLVDNIRLLKAPKLSPFPSAMLFDFVKSKTHVQRGFIGVDSRVAYSPDVGFGFKDHKTWRTHDSVYADTLHRDGLFMLKGTFAVDLPNGKYVVQLVPNGLGYWNEHFWTERRVSVEGNVLLDEEREDVESYLKDHLRFENVTPTPDDNPFDLYLKKIFKPYTAEVTVSDGQLTIDFEGTESGICLNSLIIYPAEERAKASEFLASLDAVLKDEFSTLSRDITQKEPSGTELLGQSDHDRGYYSALIGSDEQLRFNQILPSVGDSVSLKGGRGERPVQALMVHNLGEDALLTVTSSSLRNTTGKALAPEAEWIRYGVQQYQSHTMNHEIYELAPRFFKPVGEKGITVRRGESVLLWYQVPVTPSIRSGQYDGELTLAMHGKETRYPISLQVMDHVLPKADIAVGFFGLNPVSFGYFKLSEKTATEQAYRLKALEALADRGFTSWTGLPGGTWKTSKKFVSLEADETDWIMKKARELGFEHKVFSYAGWRVIDLDKHGPIAGMSQEKYRTKTAEVLKEHMEDENWLPVVMDLSDEATGYSQKVDRDLKRARMVEKYYPFLRRGGYSQPLKADEKGADLNLLMTDISLSSQTEEYAVLLKTKGIRWGLYNQAAKLFTNGRYAFGVGMYRAAKKGMDHQLGWSLTGSQNYPYYDLDGREFDAMMVFPRSDGGLDYALKFEWATQGMEDYRLLLLLEQLVRQGGPKAAEAAEWLVKVQAEPLDSGRSVGWLKSTLSLTRKAGGKDTSIPGPGSGAEEYARFRDKVYGYITALSR